MSVGEKVAPILEQNGGTNLSELSNRYRHLVKFSGQERSGLFLTGDSAFITLETGKGGHTNLDLTTVCIEKLAPNLKLYDS